MEKSNIKLLLNAEPFGFGPTAAIATFFPELRESFAHLGYIGKNHTLDLQKDLPYDDIHDSSNLSDTEIREAIASYDVFFTALDFEMADIAISLGLKVIIYDPLTWYWKVIPETIKNSDLYITQNFFGVSDRIQKEREFFPQTVEIVPSIVSQKRERVSKNYILINLGGLQNPLWSIDEVEHYARTFITTIKESIPDVHNFIIATSNAVATKIDDVDVGTYNRARMYDILENTKYAFMTPGLGNIYDAAKFNIPTIWLPPANDSQGQQLELLKEHGMSDGQIDWSDLGKPIDYFQEQTIVLKNIKEAIYSISDTSALKEIVQNVNKNIHNKENSLTVGLLQKFGSGGTERIVELISQYCQSIS